MPEMDGFETTKRLRELGGRYSLVPIIAFTAHVRDSDKERCFQAGMQGFIQKPIKQKLLLGEVESCLANSLLKH